MGVRVHGDRRGSACASGRCRTSRDRSSSIASRKSRRTADGVRRCEPRRRAPWPTVAAWPTDHRSRTTTTCGRGSSDTWRRTTDARSTSTAAVTRRWRSCSSTPPSGSDDDDEHGFTAEEMSVIPSDVTGLDGRMADVAGGASFVLCRRSAGLNSHASQWALPGGRIDAGRDGGRGGVARDRRGGRRAARPVVRARSARRLRHPVGLCDDAGRGVGRPRRGAAAEPERGARRVPDRSPRADA